MHWSLWNKRRSHRRRSMNTIDPCTLPPTGERRSSEAYRSREHAGGRSESHGNLLAYASMHDRSADAFV